MSRNPVFDSAFIPLTGMRFPIEHDKPCTLCIRTEDTLPTIRRGKGETMEMFPTVRKNWFGEIRRNFVSLRIRRG